MYNPIDLAYVAGFFDGEGCITTSIVKKKARKTHHIYSIIVITNTNLAVLEYIQSIFSFGRITEKKYDPGRKTRCWAYIIDASSLVLEFLEAIRPYLLVKVEQADLAISYLKSRLSKTPLNSNAPLSTKEIFYLFQIRRLTQCVSGDKIKYKSKFYSFPEFIDLLNSNRVKNIIRE